MSSHHPPRHCFGFVSLDTVNKTIHATFTEQRTRHYPKTEQWDFSTSDTALFNDFVSNFSGHYFNAHVRDNPDWDAVRVS